jgi:hypothetical protein
LRKLVEATFRKLQECWRPGYEPMELPSCRRFMSSIKSQLEGLKRSHETNRIETLSGALTGQCPLYGKPISGNSPSRDGFGTRLLRRPHWKFSRRLLTGAVSGVLTFHRWGDHWRLRKSNRQANPIFKEDNFVEMIDPTLREFMPKRLKSRGRRAC